MSTASSLHGHPGSSGVGRLRRPNRGARRHTYPASRASGAYAVHKGEPDVGRTGLFRRRALTTFLKGHLHQFLPLASTGYRISVRGIPLYIFYFYVYFSLHKLIFIGCFEKRDHPNLEIKIN